jgi:hypothetical protein
VTLVVRTDSLPEVGRAAEKQRDVIKVPDAAANVFKLTLKHYQDFRKPTGDNNYVITKVCLIFTCCTGLVCQVVSINE